ncbi:HD-GYP domain-containing protein [Zoogloea sp.]|uniref:HD-GYP domain-containing protein n=1 Tax=Zoogloea sp. TaxID=49181 RepID=UPI0025D065EE|nr:HD-GYP domain-containing protein [Zoogloea sp.]MCK6396471.1 HD-GYP domain-containing protein [Zoogloea sp.]
MPLKGLKLSELIGALSHALDITEGQPEGHCVRCCWIGMHVGRAMGLSDEALWELYYTLLLKDLGCSSNAARICELYLTDDLSFKHDFKSVDGSLPKVLKFVIGHTGLGASLSDRFKTIAHIFRNGDDIAQELIETRCTRGASISRQLRFSEAVAMGIHGLDEHWDGSGRPAKLAGEAIPIFSRIALLAQVVDVFNVSGGMDAACREVEDRSGSWFDPAVVAAFRRVAESAEFWEKLAEPGLDGAVFALEPGRFVVPLDEDYLDEIAAAFGQVVDSKSPYTAGHSSRVALYTDRIAEALGIDPARRRWLRRGALLHDMGKLGVSNAILDKPGKLDGDEWAAVQRHALYTESILSRIDAFEELARVSGAHHERLDGKGYPRGLQGEAISLETRIITTADIFDAITAERPYRGAVPVAKTLEIMGEEVGRAIDARCFDALKQIVGGLDLR